MDGEAVACDGDGVPGLSTEIAGATDSLARFCRRCRFRFLHLAFWLLLSFARDALVHL
jgi:hypothetical protein